MRNLRHIKIYVDFQICISVPLTKGYIINLNKMHKKEK